VIYRLLGPRRSTLRDSDVPSDSPTRPLLDAAPPTDPSASAGTGPHNLSLNPSHDQRVSYRQAHRVAAFDLRVAKMSAFINLLSYFLVCIVAGPLLFTAATCLAPLGVGFGPGLQSLAIALMPRGGEDAGKLFGALALISALSCVGFQLSSAEANFSLIHRFFFNFRSQRADYWTDIFWRGVHSDSCHISQGHLLAIYPVTIRDNWLPLLYSPSSSPIIPLRESHPRVSAYVAFFFTVTSAPATT
jgi:hypothetical protein